MEENNIKEGMKVHKDFRKLVENFIIKFKEKYGIELQMKQVTKIISDKINKAGGLKI